jgi:3-dehydroquinate synthase
LKKIKAKNNESDYPVIIGSNLSKNLPAELSKVKVYRRIFVIIDSNVYKYYNKDLKGILSSWADKIHFFKIVAGEESKSSGSVKKIYEVLVGKNFGRDTLIVSIGGGTIGDLGGFVASTYMRGVQLVHIPTTLLAAVDSSIGGKTAVNFLNVKNIIGTFYQPSLVFIDTNYLKSLPKDEIVSGTGEIIKYGFISDEGFYNYIYSNYSSMVELKESVLQKTIFECVNYKLGIVSKDLFDTKGLRRILNFGHTFAHAFESYFNFRINHGKAVAAGIVAALFLSYRKKILNRERLNNLLGLSLIMKGQNWISDFDCEKIIELMKMDKKNKRGELNFVLLKNIGEILIDVNASKREIEYALERTKEILV